RRGWQRGRSAEERGRSCGAGIIQAEGGGGATAVPAPAVLAGIKPAPQGSGSCEFRRGAGKNLWGRVHPGRGRWERHRGAGASRAGRHKPAPQGSGGCELRRERGRTCGAGFIPAEGGGSATAVPAPAVLAGIKPAPQGSGSCEFRRGAGKNLWGRSEE